MNFEDQIIFFFSALGAFNGFILSVYFAFFTKRKQSSNYFLAALIFVVSIRSIKSAFLYFNPYLSELFIQIGLSACFLIGPFLYFYTVTETKEKNRIHKTWYYHVVPIICINTVLGFLYPYHENVALWSSYIVEIIYMQWGVYTLLAVIQITPIFKKLFSKSKKLNAAEIWIVSVVLGIVVIWIAYNMAARYTSYIIGALSFSFVFYLLLLLWFFKKNKNTLFFEEKVKYKNKKIDNEKIESISYDLVVIKEKRLFKNPDIKLADIAKELNILPHTLSQYLNDNLNKSFSLFINEYRIEEAKSLLISDNNYTIEAIGYDSGFNSKSTFFTSFKKITGITPSKYREQNK